jgi:CBS domain-containing protein
VIAKDVRTADVAAHVVRDRRARARSFDRGIGESAPLVTIGLSVARRCRMSLDDVRLHDLMREVPVRLSPTQPLDVAIALMCAHRVRRPPVMHGDHLLGMVSLDDLLIASAPPRAKLALRHVLEQLHAVLPDDDAIDARR